MHVRYFVPELAVAPKAKDTLGTAVARFFGRASTPPARFTAERLGGLPFGLVPSAWPKCVDCGKSQSFLAQFAHDPDRLDLGRQGRMLMIFQCSHDPGMCAAWDAFSGANACIVVEPEELDATLTSLPNDAPPVENGVIITGWREKQDAVVIGDVAAYFDETNYFEHYVELTATVARSTKLGSVPSWIQSPSEAPKPGWSFVGQLDSSYSFLSPPNPVPAWISSDGELYEGRTHLAQGPNFGDGGIAYLFMRRTAARPEVVMFWQCG